MHLTLETYNLILWIGLALLSLLVLGFIFKMVIQPFKKRVEDSDNKLPDLDEMYNKNKHWEVKTVSEVKNYRRKIKNVEDIIAPLNNDQDYDVYEEYESQLMNSKKKITLKKLPTGLFEVERIEEDSQGNITRESFTFNKQDGDFDDILGDLADSMKDYYYNIEQSSADKEETKEYSKATSLKDEAFSKLDSMLDDLATTQQEKEQGAD